MVSSLQKNEGDNVWHVSAEFFFFFFKRLWISGCVLRRMCVSEQNLDHVQLLWKLVSASLHYELILEPAAIERRNGSVYTAACLYDSHFSHLSPQSLSVSPSVCMSAACLSASVVHVFLWLCIRFSGLSLCLLSCQSVTFLCLCVCVQHCTRDRVIVTDRERWWDAPWSKAAVSVFRNSVV